MEQLGVRIAEAVLERGDLEATHERTARGSARERGLEPLACRSRIPAPPHEPVAQHRVRVRVAGIDGERLLVARRRVSGDTVAEPKERRPAEVRRMFARCSPVAFTSA
jgi:hypothetical protein